MVIESSRAGSIYPVGGVTGVLSGPAITRERKEVFSPSLRFCGRWCPVALSLAVSLAIHGCAAGNHDRRGDLAGPAKTSALSPDECLANGQVEHAATSSTGYVIQPNDQLAIEFYLNPEFNDNVTVRPDGKITLRLVGDLPAAGMTPQELAAEIDKSYSSELRNPGAAVHVKGMPSFKVYVQGQVTKPGSFPLDPGMTTVQALADAGGVTPDAGETAVLIRRDVCGVPHGIKINIEEAMSDPARGDDAALMPRDILIVPRSSISNLDQFVQHYIRDLLPIQPYAAVPL